MADSPILDSLSALLARHKLVPFLGAGISRPQLGFAAPGLRSRLAEAMRTPPPHTADLAQVAELLEQEKGEEGLVTELRGHLTRAEFDDLQSTAHLLTFSLDCGLIYTTNQDNLFELAAQKYGRPHRTIITLADLSDAQPGERLYLKFHGIGSRTSPPSQTPEERS